MQHYLSSKIESKKEKSIDQKDRKPVFHLYVPSKNQGYP
jgi:hypothetical protein